MRLIIFITVLVVIVGGSVIIPGAAQSADPSIDVVIDGEAIDRDASVERRHDPTVEISTRIGNDSAGRIDVISIELDGATYETFDVNATSVTKEINPDLSQGDHTFNVIVKDSEGNVANFGFEVTKDSLKPKVWLTEPFRTEPREPIADRTFNDVDNNTFVFRGQVEEDTFPYEVSINRNNNRSGSGETIRSQYSDEVFSQPVALGPGENDLELKVVDGVGNHQIKRFTLTLIDNQPPRIATTSSLVVNTSTTTLEAEITDNFGVKSVSFEAEDYSQPNIIVRKGPIWKQAEPVTFSKEVELDIGFNYFTITAEDADGNQGELYVEIKREEPTEVGTDRLEILVDKEQTTFTADKQLQIKGSIVGGGIVFAQIQTVGEGGETFDIVPLHNGDPVEELEIDTTLAVGEQDTEVIIEVHDEDDTVRKEVFWVNSNQNAVFIRDEPDQAEATPTETPTPTQTAEDADANTPTRTPTEPPSGQTESTEGDEDSSESIDTVRRTTAPGLDGFGFAVLVLSFLISISYTVLRTE